MASLVFSSIGGAIAGPMGQFIGALAGARIDDNIQANLAGVLGRNSKIGNLKV